MRYLRMLTNSVIAGLIGAAYLSILVLQLNPWFPLHPRATARLFGVIALLYGVHLSAAFYVAMVARQLVATEAHSPGWLSVRTLAWLTAVTAGAAAALTWLNLRAFRTTLEADAARDMAAGAIVTTACAVVLLGLAIVRYSFRHRGTRVSAVVLAAALVASLAAPVALRGRASVRVLSARRIDLLADGRVPPTQAKLVVLIVDGASLDYVAPAAAEGRLPNFGKLLDGAAAMHLATLRPTQPGPVTAAMVTGKYPPRNGVRSAATYDLAPGAAAIDLLPDLCFSHLLVRFGLVTERPKTSLSLEARPIWSILGRFGIPVGIIGVPLTFPVRPVRGFLVSDRFHTAMGSPLEFDERQVVYPEETWRTAVTIAIESERVERAALIAGQREPDPSGAPADAGGPAATDRLYARIARELTRAFGPQVLMLRFLGIDHLGHRDLPGAPRVNGSGALVERHYAFVDQQVGEAMASLDRGDLLLVVSGFGMRPLSPGKRVLARALRDPDLAGSHEQAPDGFLLAYGGAVEPGRLPRGSLVDVAPTILYFLGLPVGRDMDGYARADLFTRGFTDDRPITYIPTYER